MSDPLENLARHKYDNLIDAAHKELETPQQKAPKEKLEPYDPVSTMQDIIRSEYYRAPEPKPERLEDRRYPPTYDRKGNCTHANVQQFTDVCLDCGKNIWS